MKRNSGIIIVGTGIIAIIIIIGLYSNQELEILKNDEPIQNSNQMVDFKNNTKEISELDKKLNEIEKKADESDYQPQPREWITSGPFQIDRSKYVIGEKIFLRIGGLEPKEKGQVAFLKPLNETHHSVFQTIPFDGTKKNQFNFYTDVRLSQALGICSVDDIVGEWTVVFRGTDYPNIKFQFINQILPGEEDSFAESVC